MTAALARIATECGIALDYVDTSERLHRVSDGTLRSLLATMGIRVDSDADAEVALAERERARWRERVAPLIVIHEGERGRLRIRLAESMHAASLGFELATESGATFDKSFAARAASTDERATIDGDTYVAYELALPRELSHGYHRVRVLADGAPIATTCCAVAPRTCHRPAALAAGGRAWGASVQLYGVRSARNWGIGDFTDLATIVQQWGAAGAAVIGVNPLHALFPNDPQRASPYSPSSRLFVNTLYVDVTAIADFRECAAAQRMVEAPAFAGALAALRDASQVDYAGVAAAKRAVLELLHAHFREHHVAHDDERAAAFRRFIADGGEALRRHAMFEALQEHFSRDDPSLWGWPVWPAAYRDPRAPDVERFTVEHAERIGFFEYVQWQADLQLAVVDGFVAQIGLGVGLYADLAVSVDRGGAEAWANQHLYALDASIGAPPDAFSPNGQCWGLPPIVPDRLAAGAYAPFIAMLRTQMRHAGALRVDHVMGLERLFWVPPGGAPADGAYVHYPAHDLFGLLALESARARCLVIGEDLGTVPPSVRDALAANDVLSCRVLYFERDRDGDFRAPEDYPERALVCATTHDLPTLAGWWHGHDIELRAAYGLIPPSDRDAQRDARIEDRKRLVRALDKARLLPQASADAALRDEIDPALARVVHEFLAATPSALLLVQPEDVVGVVDQPNLPGTTDEHPNWRRKLPLPLERWPDDARFIALTQAVDRMRHSGAPRAAVVPRATYRLQLHRDFTFADATALVPYLAELGVSHIYCSPYLRARPGSRHGYDIVDHTSLNPEIGSADAFERFVRALARHGMGHLCDVVPNHMGVMGADNGWWMDVLEHGRSSRYADFFDIDWEPLDPGMAGRILVPVLGGPYGVVLQNGELKLAFEPESGTFVVRYFDHRFPIDPRDDATIVERALAACEASLEPRAAVDVATVVARLRALPSRNDPDPERIATRRLDANELKSRLAGLVAANPALAGAMARVIDQYNGEGADGFETLHALLEQQAYRLAYWRVASDEINYRRFFDINDLAALRMENDEVFDATHAFVLDLAARGTVDGLRVDHPDGLYEPARYFERLQQRYAALAGSDDATLYVVVEKIRASHERLPASWAVHGDTGYAFANMVNGLFVDSAAKGRVDRTWRAFVGDEGASFDETAYRGKRVVMRSALAAELAVLANRATRIARADRRTRDFTLNALREAIAETVAHFPVYRTYVTERGASAQDRRFVDWAVARAKRRSRSSDFAIFDFVRQLMIGEPAPELADLRPHYVAFAMRAQQFTAPVAAKGIEDTAFYTFNRLVSVNDVGADPSRFGTTVRAFHRAAAERSDRWRATLVATSTHDNKRSEDVRARIDVISEMPAAWRLTVRRWSRMNRAHKRTVDSRPAPSRNDEYLLYQTLVGSVPAHDLDAAALDAYRARIVAYMVKAAREAKVDTSWISVNAEYEQALASFVEAILRGPGEGLFFDDLIALLPAFAWFGLLNSVSMSLIKYTQPGVPDIYQGCEVLDFSLVDPDNRRPVDFDARRSLLASLHELEAQGDAELPSAVRELFSAPYDGRAKLWVAMRALGLRHEHAELFAAGDYRPIDAAGARAKHVVAYARHREREGVIVVAGRLFASLGLQPGVLPIGDAAWADTTIGIDFVAPGTVMRNVLTGETLVAQDSRLPVARACANFPCALFAYTPRD